MKKILYALPYLIIPVSVLTLGMTAWGYRLSEKFTNNSDRIVYCVSVFVINVIMMVCIYQRFMWA